MTGVVCSSPSTGTIELTTIEELNACGDLIGEVLGPCEAVQQ